MFRSVSIRTLSAVTAIALAIPLALSANPGLRAELELAQSEAVALRASADNLTMLARTPMTYAAETHATELLRARDLADRIGVRLTGLDQQRGTASSDEIAQIDAMKAQLRRVSAHLETAIEVFGKRNGTASLHQEAYQAPVRNLYEGTRTLTNWAASPAVAAD